ncbi:MAG: PA2169 family four-helix-bundle protein [Flavobacteriaceae bacterium]|nr:PA2169 family four-helix-bundle protein [Flavobacteriaceae bacterium]
MNNSEKMTNKLNELLTKNYDAEAGYKKAAETVSNPELTQFFKNQAERRYDFGHELKDEIRNTGGTPDKGTSIKGDMHRTWMDIKSTFTSEDEEAILNEVIRGEESAVEEYQEVMKDTTLAPTTQQVLSKQVSNIQDTLQNVRRFETVAS